MYEKLQLYNETKATSGGLVLLLNFNVVFSVFFFFHEKNKESTIKTELF